jgi:hypothetical protein
MITVPSYINLPEVVPQAELQAWKQKNRDFWSQATAPAEVKEFIEMVCDKLGDFTIYRWENTFVKGEDFLLVGINEIDGKPVNPIVDYPLQMPVYGRADFYGRMMRLFKKQGKKGLVDFCKREVKPHDLPRVLEILNVHVFHEERPEYKEIITRIENSKSMKEAWPLVREKNKLEAA